MLSERLIKRSADTMEIYNLRVNHLKNPLGYKMEKTVFSWKVRGSKGKQQVSAKIRVGYSEDLVNCPLVKDTGFDPTASSLAYPVVFPLKPYTRYYWDVTVKTDAGEELTSPIQWFETAKMEEHWSSKWITCDKSSTRSPYFEKDIKMENTVKKARLYICGLGLYEGYYNGHRIGDEYLTPYCNDYNEWVQYQTYDMTEMLKNDGKLTILLGDGWYKGRFGFEGAEELSRYGDEWKLLAELRIEYIDGKVEVIGTDESWQVQRSNVTFSNIYDGEHVDDTLPESDSEPVLLCEAPKAQITARISTPVTIHEKITPVELIQTPAGELVLDLGQEFSGIFKLRVKEPYGSRIHIQTGEVLQQGNFYNGNLRTAKSEYIYTSDGIEKEIIPHFTFFGYRYVKIQGISNLKKEDFTGLALYSEIPPVGEIVTGNDLVNKLISNVRWGMKGNFLDVPTDCPQRDERMGWTGDAQVFAATATYLSDTYAFYRKYLYDLAKEQSIREGKVPNVVPAFGMEGCSSVWGDAACIIPWNLYMFYGDKAILEEQFTSMKSWVDYIRKVDDEKDGWSSVFHYGDWLALDHPVGKDERMLGGTDEGFIADVYYAVSAGIVAKTAKILGFEEEAEFYKKISDNQFTKVKDSYFSKTGRCCFRTQTALLLTLKYHLSSDEEKIRETLIGLFNESRGKLQTGFVGTPIMCHVLSEQGLNDLAYHLLTNEEFPGWLYEVKLGATTIWERWNSLDENGNISSTGMNSLNHYSYGSIVEWIFRHSAGINIDEEPFRVSANRDILAIDDAVPGFRQVVFEPVLSRELGSVQASYNSAAGVYESAWSFSDENQVTVKVSVPFGCRAKLILPQIDRKLFNDKQNPMFSDVREGVCYLESGEYCVSYNVIDMASKYSIDSPLWSLLDNKEVREAIAGFVPIDKIPEQFTFLTLYQIGEKFAGVTSRKQLDSLDKLLNQY